MFGKPKEPVLAEMSLTLVGEALQLLAFVADISQDLLKAPFVPVQNSIIFACG